MSTTNRRDALRAIGGTLALPLLPGIALSIAAEGDVIKKPIKVGQIGVGHAHANKLAVFRDSPDFEVVGIVETDEALRNKARSQAAYRDLPWMTEEQLLNVSGLELVLVETQVRDLLNTAETCVAAGKHIHLDKPAGASLSQFRRILDRAAQQKLLVQMGYMYRYNPAIVLLREVLKQGWLGDPFEVHAVMSKVINPDRRRQLAEYPGGVMFELGCHLIDLVVGVLGAPQKVTPYPQQIGGDDRLVNNMLAVFEYPKALATVKSSALEVEGFKRRHFVVCGTEGTFHIQPLDAPTVRVAFSSPHAKYKKGYQDIALPKYKRYVDDAADIASILRGKKTVDFSYEHDLAVQTAVLQASALPLN
ncbi:MAG: Gfo/Idh/MocA family oxidoreductase [Planctomycetes bacterium]|nr:Gfo/Idh/MocA family oxidoreductase [Planctomycetota bacterium]